MMDWMSQPGADLWRTRLHPESLDILLAKGYERGLPSAIEALYSHQSAHWIELQASLQAFRGVLLRPVPVSGREVLLQFNPARLASATAPVSAEAIKARPCFLCPPNMPSGQRFFPFGPGLAAVVNPFPIFRRHIVVLSMQHRPQTVAGTLGPMIDFSRASGFCTLYNGPGSGASAPDHFHFQAGPVGSMPFEKEALALSTEHEGLFVRPGLPQRLYILSRDRSRALEMFENVSAVLRELTGRDEPEMNLALCPRPGAEPAVAIHPRGKHRPDCYYREGAGRRMVSPGSCDMAGLVILPRLEDFERLDGQIMEDIYREVGLPENLFEDLLTRMQIKQIQ